MVSRGKSSGDYTVGVLLLSVLAIHALLAFVSNLQDPGCNLNYIRHVISMDTVPAGKLKNRAIANGRWAIFLFVVVLCLELVVALFCGAGAILYLLEHEHARDISTIGLMAAIIFWFLVCKTIGMEWFVAWRSKDFRFGEGTNSMIVITILTWFALK
jgi:predicted small integral membrane protein